MTWWRRWLQRPQERLLRKALFQIHLWAGIGVGVCVGDLRVRQRARLPERTLQSILAQTDDCGRLQRPDGRSRLKSAAFAPIQTTRSPT
jgi:hypothetical protein